MHYRLSSLAVLFLSLTLCVNAADEDKQSTSLTEVGELNEAYVTAFNARDAKKIGTLFASKGDFTLLTGDAIGGRDQITAAHASFFGSNPDAKISGKQLTARFVRPGVLIATGKWNVKNGPSAFPADGIWSTVVSKKNGKWMYEAMRLMVPAKPSN